MEPTMGGTVTAQTLPARADVRSTSRGACVRAFCVLLVLLAALAFGAASFPASATAGLADSIDSALQSAGLGGSGTGVYVWDLDAALPVYELNSSTPLTPASNLKLVTSAAAVFGWGYDHRFITELYAPDEALNAGGTLDGDLYLRGLGDPTLSTRTYQKNVFGMTTASFERFARGLKRDGLRKIKGRVLGDAAWFDKVKTVPSWKDGLQLECGPLSALSGNQGLENGNRVAAPATHAARLMTEALRKAGIKVKGKPGAGKVPDTARLADQQYSAALRAVLKRMNKDSDNFFAEMVLKGLGKEFYGEGSTAAGTRASRDALHALGVRTGTYVIQDGSGLSYGNRMTAEGLVKVLGAMRQRDDFDDYYDSLAIAGKDGTLDDRMRGTAAAGNARAKTGTLNVAICLSGYVTSANDHLAAFAILMNGGSVDWATATKAQDKIVVALAKASLPGEPLLAVTPVLRQHSVSALEAVHGAGGDLKPGVQP
jgi:D-alanyl-D-alanine carboxypeptidase/D-alanyl-D-alanine-endopeptidase (penicillin-binding protein 4)